MAKTTVFDASTSPPWSTRHSLSGLSDVVVTRLPEMVSTQPLVNSFLPERSCFVEGGLGLGLPLVSGDARGGCRMECPGAAAVLLSAWLPWHRREKSGVCMRAIGLRRRLWMPSGM